MYFFVFSIFYWSMIFDDNLVGILMLVKKGVVEDINVGIIRFRKIIVLYGIDDF